MVVLSNLTVNARPNEAAALQITGGGHVRVQSCSLIGRWGVNPGMGLSIVDARVVVTRSAIEAGVATPIPVGGVTVSRTTAFRESRSRTRR